MLDLVFVCSKAIGGCGFEESGLCVATRLQVEHGFEFFEVVNVIDPSAGSPTETLLRLLLPRNVQI